MHNVITAISNVVRRLKRYEKNFLHDTMHYRHPFFQILEDVRNVTKIYNIKITCKNPLNHCPFP